MLLQANAKNKLIVILKSIIVQDRFLMVNWVQNSTGLGVTLLINLVFEFNRFWVLKFSIRFWVF